jgi:hypothetical protein
MEMREADDIASRGVWLIIIARDNPL